MGNDAEMWRIEFWIKTGGEGPGRFEREYIESDEDAHTRLMELEIDLTLADSSGMNWPAKRRATAWLRRRPQVPTPNSENYEHVREIKAWRMVDGEWREATWTLIEPDIDVFVK